jgi:hypothetical protein
VIRAGDKVLGNVVYNNYNGGDTTYEWGPRDVFVVELRPFNDLSGTVPQNVRAIRKELIHAVFWRRR